MRDASSIGINWTSVLKDFNLNGLVEFGTGGALGQIYPRVDNSEVTGGSGEFVDKISLTAQTFSVFLNALEEEGDTKILSNPKISVMNGQPALISVGTNITYISKVTSKVDENGISYTAETDQVDAFASEPRIIIKKETEAVRKSPILTSLSISTLLPVFVILGITTVVLIILRALTDKDAETD